MNITPVFNPERPSDSEQRVLDAIADRGVADFTAEPAAARRLHGAFIEALISGSQPGIPQLCCPLRLRGAEIIGPIRALPAAGNGVAMTLLFRECRFDSPVDFSGGDFLSLRLVHCTLPALIGISLTTRADLDLSGSQFSGVTDYLSDLGEVGDCAVYLSHAHIGGRLLLSAG
ncbi:MAG: hypothetical protein RJQ10_14485, partial [Haliea sp.]|uniref:hypothetical protein n=1 Tax=Haliea sp. TaxID=1932666 RepID=UPI0032ECD46B